MVTCPKCLGRLREVFSEPCGWCGGSGQAESPRTVTLAMRDIHNGIRLWHDGQGEGLELHQYLGLTWVEFKVWATYGRLPEHCAWFDPKEIISAMAKTTLRLG